MIDGFQDVFRDKGANTYFGTKRSPVIFEKNLVYTIVFTIVLSAALTILVIGSRGRERWTTLLRVIISLHSGVVILVTVMGLDWQTASITSMCSYISTYKGDIEASVLVHTGLKQVNITLTGHVNASEYMGSVKYNERFSFDKVTDMEAEYRAALNRGLPWPIMSVLEYLSIDSGGLHWMRNFHESGHFAYIILWCALVIWFTAIIIINFVILRGAFLWTLAGITMVTANIVYHTLQPRMALHIEFKDDVMRFHYGWCFWLNLVSGLITMLSGLTVLICYHIFPYKTNLIFLLNTTNVQKDTDEIAVTGTLIITPLSRKRLFMTTTYSNSNELEQATTSEKMTTSRKRKNTLLFHIEEFNFINNNLTEAHDTAISETTKLPNQNITEKKIISTSNPKSVYFNPVCDEYETQHIPKKKRSVSFQQGQVSNLNNASNHDNNASHDKPLMVSVNSCPDELLFVNTK